MNWQEAMLQDAAAVAFEDYEPWPGDRIELDGDWEDGWGYSTYTFEDPEFNFSVRVWRRSGLLGNEQVVRTRNFPNDEAGEFWKKLMERGSK